MLKRNASYEIIWKKISNQKFVAGVQWGKTIIVVIIPAGLRTCMNHSELVKLKECFSPVSVRKKKCAIKSRGSRVKRTNVFLLNGKCAEATPPAGPGRQRRQVQCNYSERYNLHNCPLIAIRSLCVSSKEEKLSPNESNYRRRLCACVMCQPSQ